MLTHDEALAVLGLRPGCSQAEIRQEYLDLVRVWHPERFGDDARLSTKAESRLQELTAAYDVLRDPSEPVASVSDVEPPPGAPRNAPRRAPDQPDLLWTSAWTGLGVAGGALLTVMLAGSALFDRPAATPGVETLPEAANAAPPTVAQRPESGTELLGPFATGLGTFVIENLTDRDAVIVLARGDSQERALYVRNGERLTVSNIAAGSYRILVTGGSRWNEGHFDAEPSYGEFDQPADFMERDGPDGTDSTSFTLSLQQDAGGIAQTRPLAAFTVRDSR